MTTPASTSPYNYQEAIAQGRTWRRFNNVQVANPYMATPVISVEETKVFELADGTAMQTPFRALREQFAPNMPIPLIDLVTGEPTGKVVKGIDVYQHVYSYCVAMSLAQDQIESAMAAGAGT